MDLSTTLLKKFAQVTNDENTSSTSKIAYGTVTSTDGTIMVQLDGSEYETAVVSTLDVEKEDRVIVTIEDHTATITSNITVPSSGRTATTVTETLVEYIHYADDYFAELSAGIANIDEAYITKLIAESAEIKDLIVEMAQIDDAYIINLVSESAEIKDLIVETAQIDDAYITNLIAESAEIQDLIAGTVQAEIGDFDEIYAKTAYVDVLYARIVEVSESLSAEVANITTLLSGTIGTGELTTIVLTADNAVMDSTFIDTIFASNAIIDRLTSGVIYTSDITIQTAEEDDSLWISNSLIQISDENRVRIQMGKDNRGDFNYYLWDENGNLQWNALGVTGDGINDEVIVNKHVAENAAISGTKLDLQSVVDKINEDGNLTINAANIVIDENTLDYELSKMTEKITGLEGVTADGMISFTAYWAKSTSCTVAPLTEQIDDVIPAILDTAEADRSYVDIYEAYESVWSTTQPTIDEEDAELGMVYIWMFYLCEYNDGHTESTTPILITDDYVYSTMIGEIWTKFEIVDGSISSIVGDVYNIGENGEKEIKFSTTEETEDMITSSVNDIKYYTDEDGNKVELWSTISYIYQTADSITQEVHADYASNDDLSGAVSSLKQYVNDGIAGIELSVTGGLGDNAYIKLTAGTDENGNPVEQTGEVELKKIREAFAKDEGSEVEIGGKTVTFVSDTFQCYSTYFEVTGKGELTATSGHIGGWSLDEYGLSSTSKDEYGDSFTTKMYPQSFSQEGPGTLITISGGVFKSYLDQNDPDYDDDDYVYTEINQFGVFTRLVMATTLDGIDINAYTLRVDNLLNVQNSFNVYGSTVLSGTLEVSGKTTLNSSLTVSSSTTLNSSLTVSSSTTLNSSLTVASSTTLNSSLTVNGNATITTSNTSTARYCNVTNRYGSMDLRVGTQGNEGLYSQDRNEWILYADGGYDSIVIKFTGIYSNTVSSSPNVYVGSGGRLSRYKSSSARYKNHIIALSNPEYSTRSNIQSYDLVNSNNMEMNFFKENALSLLKLPVSIFNYNEGYMTGEKDFDYSKPIVGFIAEDVEKLCPECVVYQEYNDRKTDIVENWSAQEMVPRIIFILQYQQKLIEDQAIEIEQLKAKA